MSGAFALIGAAIAYRLYLNRDKACFMWVLFAFYAGMEFLQFMQHRTLNQCDAKENRALAVVAFLYVVVQPFLWQYYAYRCHSKTPFQKGVFALSMVLSVVVAISFIMRWNTGTDSKGTDIMTGELCTKKDDGHLYWQWPIGVSHMNVANWFMFMVVWLLPLFFADSGVGLFMSGGAVLAFMMSKKSVEFASTWCLTSLPLLLGGLALNLY